MAALDRVLSAIGWPTQPPPYAGTSPSFAVQNYGTIDLANDVGFPDFLRGGYNHAGAAVNRRTVMRNTAVKRSVNLISNVIATLPLPVLQDGGLGDDKKATDHPLYSILGYSPNTRQDAYQFRKLMQRWLLIDGNAYAQILRSRGRVTGLIPHHPSTVRGHVGLNGEIVYKVQRTGIGSPSDYTFNESAVGGELTIAEADMFHLYGDSDNGYSGISLVDEAGEALGVSLQADRAAARLFKHGALIRDVLSHDKLLSPAAIENLKGQLQEKFGGADNAAKTLVLEEGMTYSSLVSNARDSQHLETRRHQVEEIGRIFGMPRPFLMMDDTSWGSGIEQLGMFFVTYTLAPWLKAWESAISRQLFTPEDRRAGFYPKFNERALLRGSMKDQAEFLTKMMGSGGAPQIMEQNEARGYLDLPEHADGFGLNSGAVNASPINGGSPNGTTG
jgi:HK97 family phage portal protein